MRGWSELYRTSLELGARYLRRHGYAREAVIRLVVPLDPSRYLELPWALDRLDAQVGQTVLDLASPKLLAVTLARRGARVTTLDQLESEIEVWRRLAEGEPNLTFVVGDGRSMPFDDESFDHATSISVLEHIAGDRGDEAALGELVRCVRPGGRLAITLPYASKAYVEYRKAPAYVDHGERDDRGQCLLPALVRRPLPSRASSRRSRPSSSSSPRSCGCSPTSAPPTSGRSRCSCRSARFTACSRVSGAARAGT